MHEYAKISVQWFDVVPIRHGVDWPWGMAGHLMGKVWACGRWPWAENSSQANNEIKKGE